ncbi:MAG: PfkB family carbohydrate kinase, partial [Paracoccaceae bacterium]
TEALLTQIATDPAFGAADLRVAPASPGKALRLRPFLMQSRGTLYVNLEEAGLLCDHRFDATPEAARALIAAGAPRALVTDGAEITTDASAAGVVSLAPPRVDRVGRITGAGDTFMATHMDAELRGMDRTSALQCALRAAADYVSQEVGT